MDELSTYKQYCTELEAHETKYKVTREVNDNQLRQSLEGVRHIRVEKLSKSHIALQDKIIDHNWRSSTMDLLSKFRDEDGRIYAEVHEERGKLKGRWQNVIHRQSRSVTKAKKEHDAKYKEEYEKRRKATENGRAKARRIYHKRMSSKPDSSTKKEIEEEYAKESIRVQLEGNKAMIELEAGYTAKMRELRATETEKVLATQLPANTAVDLNRAPTYRSR